MGTGTARRVAQRPRGARAGGLGTVFGGCEGAAGGLSVRGLTPEAVSQRLLRGLEQRRERQGTIRRDGAADGRHGVPVAAPCAGTRARGSVAVGGPGAFDLRERQCLLRPGAPGRGNLLSDGGAGGKTAATGGCCGSGGRIGGVTRFCGWEVTGGQVCPPVPRLKRGRYWPRTRRPDACRSRWCARRCRRRHRC